MHGEAAISWMKKHPVDIVILDVEMPVMDGLTALGRIQSEFSSVRVVMASGLTYQGAKTTVKALATALPNWLPRTRPKASSSWSARWCRW